MNVKKSICYSICPVVDYENFIGISQDADFDNILVTLSKNEINSFSVSNPIQRASWITKGPISCACIYDRTSNQYLAVFNNNEIRMWGMDETNIDKVKKYKFKNDIYSLLLPTASENILIVFKCGAVSSLEDGINERKSDKCGFIKDSEEIVFVGSGSLNSLVTVVIVTQKVDGEKFLYALNLNNSETPYFSLKIEETDESRFIQGCVVANNDVCNFISLWSDVSLKCIEINPATISNEDISFENLTNLSTYINPRNGASILPLYSDSLAIYSEKSDGNGACLVIHSLKLKITSSIQRFKTFSKPTKLWHSNERIFLLSNSNLLTLSYFLDSQKLKNIIGSKVVAGNNNLDENEDDEKISDGTLFTHKTLSVIEKGDVLPLLQIANTQSDLSDETVAAILAKGLTDTKKYVEVIKAILLHHTISDAKILPTYISVDASIKLFDELSVHFISGKGDDKKISSWMMLLLDAFYQAYLLTNQESIKNKLLDFRTSLQNECDSLNVYKSLSALGSRLKRKSRAS